MIKELTIGTRGSALALWQAEHIKSRLQQRYSGLSVALNIIKTSGDKIQDVPLAKVGGKGLFTKEIEEALLDGSADIAVHSMKDVPAELPEGLTLGVIPEREEPTDCLLSEHYASLEDLPEGAVLGTSSLRRQAQSLHLRPDLVIKMLRGNLDTRIRKLKEGQFDAIIAAAAGLNRLGITATHRFLLGPPDFLPAVGQGALGLEYKEDRQDLEEMIGFLDHPASRICVTAERAFLHRLEGGCQVPIAGHARITANNTVHLVGLVCDLKGERTVRREGTAKTRDAASLGTAIADEILEAGGLEILEEVYREAE